MDLLLKYFFVQAMVVIVEFIVDWLKHAFITKFNGIPSEVYKGWIFAYRLYLVLNFLIVLLNSFTERQDGRILCRISLLGRNSCFKFFLFFFNA